ncbi:MAG: GNAT family protein [Pseudomonadota bacterium]
MQPRSASPHPAGRMDFQITPNAEVYFRDLHQAVDSVAREKKYLALLRAPPYEEAVAFYRDIISKQQIQLLGLLDGQLVGWCDILPAHGDVCAHIGVLGIGLLPQARRQGLGQQLMQAAIAQAWENGLTRIELIVRTDNHGAKHLYEKLGFQVEGIQRKANCVDGKYFDTYAMALLR